MPKALRKKRPAAKKCSTPIPERNQTSSSVGLSTIDTNSSSAEQEYPRHRVRIESVKRTARRIPKKRIGKENVRRRSARTKSSDTDADWETETETSTLEDAALRRLSLTPEVDVDSPTLFRDLKSPERVRDAPYSAVLTLDESILPVFDRNAVAFSKDAADEEDELLRVEYWRSSEIERTRVSETEDEVGTYMSDQFSPFNSARVTKSYPAAVKAGKSSLAARRNTDWLGSVPLPTASSDILWREFMKDNNDGSRRNSSDSGERIRADSTDEESMQISASVGKVEMKEVFKRWDAKFGKWIRVNTYGLREKDESGGKNGKEVQFAELRRRYLKRKERSLNEKRAAEDSSNDSINYEHRDVSISPTNRTTNEHNANNEESQADFEKENVEIPSPSKRAKMISDKSRKLTRAKKLSRKTGRYNDKRIMRQLFL